MRKFVVSMFALALLAVAVKPSQAGMKFEIEEGFNFFGDSRLEGQNRHFGVSFDMNESVDVGLYTERANLQLTGDVGAIPPNTTMLNVDYQAIRISKKFRKWLEGGIDIGSAKIQQGATTGIAATAALNQNKPFVGLNATARHAIPVKDKITTDLHISLGYRWLDLNDVTLIGAPAGEATLDDLNALIIGVGFGLSF